MGRTHAWTLKGHVRVDPRPMNWGNNLTMIGAVRCDQWLTMSTMFQSANKDRFVQWVRRRLLPKLRSGDVLILDNAPAHKDPRLVPLLRSRGVALRYLPPYSPDFNPIESAWALVKKGIRACAPRTRDALQRATTRLACPLPQLDSPRRLSTRTQMILGVKSNLRREPFVDQERERSGRLRHASE